MEGAAGVSELPAYVCCNMLFWYMSESWHHPDIATSKQVLYTFFQGSLEFLMLCKKLAGQVGVDPGVIHSYIKIPSTCNSPQNVPPCAWFKIYKPKS